MIVFFLSLGNNFFFWGGDGEEDGTLIPLPCMFSFSQMIRNKILHVFSLLNLYETKFSLFFHFLKRYEIKFRMFSVLQNMRNLATLIRFASLHYTAKP